MNRPSWMGRALALKDWLESQGYSVAWKHDGATVWYEDVEKDQQTREAFRAHTQDGKEP